MISPEALEKARSLVANYGSDPDGLLVGAIAAALQAERDAATPKLPDDLAALPGEPVAWIGPQSWEALQRDGRVQTEIAKEEFMGPRRKRWVALYASTLPVMPITDEDVERRFKLDDRVTKTKGSSWTGRVVGFYSTTLTPIGYAVESENEPGSVQIYPEAALDAAGGRG